MPTGGWQIARIGSVAVRIQGSLLVVVVLVTFVQWQSFERLFPRLSEASTAGLAALTAVLLIGSILVHELAHAGAYRALGIPVLGITLWALGGVTYAQAEARRARDSAFVSAVGPLSSAALGALFLVAREVADGLPTPLLSMLGYVGVVNLILAVFNMLPGFPLDGGQILRAGLWQLLGDRTRATRIAARIGQVIALALAAYGLWAAFTDPRRGGLWTALIGWVLFQAASQTLREGERREALRSTAAAAVMGPPPPTIPAAMSAGEAIERVLAGHDGELFPVLEDGRVIGFVSPADARAIASDRPIRESVRTVGVTVQAAPTDPMDVVLQRMEEQSARMALIVDGDRVAGVVEPDDLDRFFRGMRGAPPAQRRD